MRPGVLIQIPAGKASNFWFPVERVIKVHHLFQTRCSREPCRPWRVWSCPPCAPLWITRTTRTQIWGWPLMEPPDRAHSRLTPTLGDGEMFVHTGTCGHRHTHALSPWCLRWRLKTHIHPPAPPRHITGLSTPSQFSKLWQLKTAKPISPKWMKRVSQSYHCCQCASMRMRASVPRPCESPGPHQQPRRFGPWPRCLAPSPCPCPCPPPPSFRNLCPSHCWPATGLFSNRTSAGSLLWSAL